MKNIDTTGKDVQMIRKTMDYPLFRTLDNNRHVNQVRVNRLAELFKHHCTITPIEVMHKDDDPDHFYIVDGQHRFNAWRKLKLPIYYFETISGDDTTQGLYARNQGKSWGTIDIVDSFGQDNRKPDVQAQYLELRDIIDETQDEIGRVPLTPLIELAQGINKALTQQVVLSHHDFKDGKYITKNRSEFEEVIQRIAIVQKNAKNPIKMTAAMFRALFTIMSIKTANAAFLGQTIKSQQPKWRELEALNDDHDTTAGLLNLYNSLAPIHQQKMGSWVDNGLLGIKINDKTFDVYLENEK